MHLAMTLNPMRDADLQYAQQLGADWVMVDPPAWDSETLAAACYRVEQARLHLAGLECLPQSLYAGAVLGSPERDAEIERICRLLRTLGQLGVPMVGYRWFASLPPCAPTTLADRGSVVSPTYRLQAESAEAARAACEAAWEQLGYFLPPVLQAAEESGVRLAHQVGLPASPWPGDGQEGLAEL